MTRIPQHIYRDRLVIMAFLFGLGFFSMAFGVAQAGDDDGIAGYSMRAKAKDFDRGDGGGGAEGPSSGSVVTFRDETSPIVLGTWSELASRNRLVTFMEQVWFWYTPWRH